jgi:hypothetical protein
MTTPDPKTQVGVTRPNLLRAAGSGLTTQLNIRQTLPWRDVIYTPDIDKLLAETALDDTDPDVAEQAARVIGRIRSEAAVKEIAQRQREGADGALRALAYVADEALSLPRVVSVQAQLYAMLANTWRRLTLKPMRGVWRLIFALLGTWLAMGAYVWVNLPGLAIFNPDRWGKSVSWGLTVAVFMGLTVLIASDLPTRLRGFWPWWLCALSSLILGTLFGAFTWAAFTYFFLNYAPDPGLMLRGGFGLGVAFVITTLFYQMRGWMAVIITFLGIYIPLYLAFQGFWNDPVTNAAIIYFRNFDEVYTQLIPMVLVMAIGVNAFAVWRDLRDLAAWVRGRLAERRKGAVTVDGS